MRHSILSAVALSAVLAQPAQAQLAQAQGLTPAQRDDVVRTMRDALRADPSILRDALAALQADDARSEETAARSAIAAQRPALLADASDPVAGNPAGSVTVVEFYDTRCPYCRSMLPVMADLVRTDPSVRIVYKDIPILGPASIIEAKALLAAQRQGRYLDMQGAVMHQPAPSTPASLRADGARLGLDTARLETDMADPAIAARINKNLGLAEALHVQGTPALVIGDRMLPGAATLAELRDAVAAARPR